MRSSEPSQHLWPPLILSLFWSNCPVCSVEYQGPPTAPEQNILSLLPSSFPISPPVLPGTHPMPSAGPLPLFWGTWHTRPALLMFGGTTWDVCGDGQKMNEWSFSPGGSVVFRASTVPCELQRRQETPSQCGPKLSSEPGTGAGETTASSKAGSIAVKPSRAQGRWLSDSCAPKCGESGRNPHRLPGLSKHFDFTSIMKGVCSGSRHVAGCFISFLNVCLKVGEYP